MFLVHHPVTFKGRIYQTLEVTILQERSSTLPKTWRNSERKLTKSWKWPVLSLGGTKAARPFSFPSSFIIEPLLLPAAPSGSVYLPYYPCGQAHVATTGCRGGGTARKAGREAEMKFLILRAPHSRLLWPLVSLTGAVTAKNLMFVEPRIYSINQKIKISCVHVA